MDKVILQGEGTELDRKLQQVFAGKVVKKSLVRQMKATSNLPVFVLEFLLSIYCTGTNSDEGLDRIREVLFHNFQASHNQMILSKLRKNGNYTVMDRVCVHLNIKKNAYAADLATLGYKNIYIDDKYPEKYSRLLTDGIWCVVKLQYAKSIQQKEPAVSIASLAPVQVPNINLHDYIEARQFFSKQEWINILIRSCGLETDIMTDREKWLLLLRLVPLCENNYNLCELGPRSTGKSFVYKEISSYCLLVSGGQSTASNLFYNQSTRVPGLVTAWDCVAFDEVAGIQLRDRDSIQIMKDYMASGSFVRGRHLITGNASLVFIGNIDKEQEDEEDLFSPFPTAIANDSAFLDRIHAYLPGWELPKLYPKHFTASYGLVSDYLCEILRHMRQIQFGDLIDRYFRLGDSFNQRDAIAIRKTVSGLIKLVHPNGELDQNDMQEILEVALEMRQRVKKQLYKLNEDEYPDYLLSYSVLDT